MIKDNHDQLLWCFKMFDGPEIPEQFVQPILSGQFDFLPTAQSQRYSQEEKKIYTGRQLVKNHKKISHVNQNRYQMTPDFCDWISNNVCKNYLETTVTIGDQKIGSNGPHTDRARRYSLIYVIKTGGPETTTTFWKQHGYPLLRPRGTLIDDYDCLEQVDQICIKPFTWVLLNGMILHSIEKLHESRISFQIAMDEIDEIKNNIIQ